MYPELRSNEPFEKKANWIETDGENLREVYKLIKLNSCVMTLHY